MTHEPTPVSCEDIRPIEPPPGVDYFRGEPRQDKTGVWYILRAHRGMIRGAKMTIGSCPYGEGFRPELRDRTWFWVRRKGQEKTNE